MIAFQIMLSKTYHYILSNYNTKFNFKLIMINIRAPNILRSSYFKSASTRSISFTSI